LEIRHYCALLFQPFDAAVNHRIQNAYEPHERVARENELAGE
jgi:hypothetical protein